MPHPVTLQRNTNSEVETLSLSGDPKVMRRIASELEVMSHPELATVILDAIVPSAVIDTSGEPMASAQFDVLIPNVENTLRQAAERAEVLLTRFGAEQGPEG